MSDAGHLFILSGPAGAGKGTLRKILFNAVPDLVFSISCTTRDRRPGEVDAKDYYFVNREQFDELVDDEAFLEWAEVHGNCYGTRKADVLACIDSGRDMILEIDVQGCRQVKARMPQAIRIFITVPSLDALEERLEERGTETPEQMNLRLRNAAVELSQAGEYEHIIVNDDLNRSSRELIDLIKRYRVHEEGEI